MTNKIRVRYAPSPTGLLHIGNARTALFNYLYARHHGGDFIIRIEDTDRKRHVEDGERSQLENLRWLGMDWDESPETHENYRQSERLALYKKYIDQLLAEGKAYKSYVTEEELAAERERQEAAGETPRYINEFLGMSADEKAAYIAKRQAAGIVPTVRLKVNDEQIEIGGTNYGSKIPSKVTKKSKDTSSVIWVTHHDLMFKDYYPGSQPLQEIEGVSIAVNGHMHGTQPQIQVKSTTWCCPGNITRQSVDMSEHIPRVWLWNLQHHNDNYEKLIPIDLTYKKDIFRQIHIVEADKKNDFSLSKTDDKKLSFIEMAENAVSQIDNNATSDKELVRNFMANLFNIEEVPKDIQIELFEMLENVAVETEE